MSNKLRELVTPISLSQERKQDIEDVKNGKKHIYSIRPQSSYLNPKIYHSRNNTMDSVKQNNFFTKSNSMVNIDANFISKKTIKEDKNFTYDSKMLKTKSFKHNDMFRVATAKVITNSNIKEKLKRLDTSNKQITNPKHLNDFEENWKLLDKSLAKNPFARCKSSYNIRQPDSPVKVDVKEITGGIKFKKRKNDSENAITNKSKTLHKPNSYSDLTNIVNQYHPKVHVKDFNELRIKKNYQDVLNETIEFYDKADLENQSLSPEIPPDKYTIFEYVFS